MNMIFILLEQSGWCDNMPIYYINRPLNVSRSYFSMRQQGEYINLVWDKTTSVLYTIVFSVQIGNTYTLGSNVGSTAIRTDFMACVLSSGKRQSSGVLMPGSIEDINVDLLCMWLQTVCHLSILYLRT